MDGAFLSEEALWRGPLGTLVDMLRKSLYAGISLHGGHFPVERNLYVGGARISGTLMDE